MSIGKSQLKILVQVFAREEFFFKTCFVGSFGIW